MTMDENSFDEIKAQLEHPFIRERQAALEKIRARLEHNDHVRQCVELLQGVIRKNEYQIVTDKAQDILTQWQARNQVVRAPADRQHIFGVLCPNCGYQNYYDKRQVCGSPGSIFLGVTAEQEDQLILECKNCHQPLVVNVDCEGYK